MSERTQKLAQDFVDWLVLESGDSAAVKSRLADLLDGAWGEGYCEGTEDVLRSLREYYPMGLNLVHTMGVER